MDTFFILLKKSLVAIMFVIFGFVTTYVPHTFNQVEPAEAWESTLWMQIVQNVSGIATNIATTASAAFDKITSWATGSLFTKEFVLDGIAWAIAKTMVSVMVSSLIDWINSGFEGRPAFVQDLQGFLRNAADEAVGEYLNELGGLGSYVCEPFRLDVQISLALQYEQSRVNQSAPKCTLSDIVDNVDGFLSGTQGSFSQGGWNDWFDLTSKPQTNTPYGAVLAAQQNLDIRVLNKKNEESTILDFGDGFLSGKVCDMINIDGITKESCSISKPGKIIEEALSFNLDSGRQSLIAADEIDEIIASLIGQLANTVITGAAGLLGLSGGTGHTYDSDDFDFDSGSYTDNLTTEESLGSSISGDTLFSDSIDDQEDIRTDAESSKKDLENTVKDLEAYLTAFTDSSGFYYIQPYYGWKVYSPAKEKTINDLIAKSKDAIDDADAIIDETTANIGELKDLVDDYAKEGLTAEERGVILTKYTALDLNSSAGLSLFADRIPFYADQAMTADSKVEIDAVRSMILTIR